MTTWRRQVSASVLGAIVGVLVELALRAEPVVRYIMCVGDFQPSVETFLGNLTRRLATGAAYGALVGFVLARASGHLGRMRSNRHKEAPTPEERFLQRGESLPASVVNRPWYQYRLRTLLLLFVLASIPMSRLAVHVQRAARERQARETVARLGGKVSYGTVDLRNTKVADSDLSCLHYLPRVETIYLCGTAISDAGVANLGGLRNITYLSLADTQITDDALVYIGQFTKLEFLYLSGTRVRGTGLPHLAALQRLMELRLVRTSIEDEQLRELPDLPELRKLDLGETKISDRGLDQMKAYPNLEVIGLRRTRVTPMGALEFAARRRVGLLVPAGEDP